VRRASSVSAPDVECLAWVALTAGRTDLWFVLERRGYTNHELHTHAHRLQRPQGSPLFNCSVLTDECAMRVDRNRSPVYRWRCPPSSRGACRCCIRRWDAHPHPTFTISRGLGLAPGWAPAVMRMSGVRGTVAHPSRCADWYVLCTASHNALSASPRDAMVRTARCGLPAPLTRTDSTPARSSALLGRRASIRSLAGVSAGRRAVAGHRELAR
jgi:hypothetical protein